MMELAEVDERNHTTSQLEILRFRNQLSHEARIVGSYFAYAKHYRTTTRLDLQRLRKGDRITTWMNDKLGIVREVFTSYRSNMGDYRQRFRMLGIDGREWYGVYYYSAGDYVRLRLCKVQS